MIRNWLAPAVLIALTFLFILFWDSPPQNFFTPEEEVPTAAKYPTNILYNSVSRKYDEKGQLNSVLVVSEAHYFQINPKKQTPNDYADLKEPDLTFYSADKPPWQVTSLTGKATNNGDLIELWGDVHLWQSDANNRLSELTTPYLVVKPELQYAETDKPVTINSPGNTTNAVGMKAYLQKDTIQLLSKVRGIHEP